MAEKREYPVGTPGFYNIGSDTYPVTIVAKVGATYWVRHEKFVGDKKAGHNYFGNQKWKITQNPHGRVEEVVWKPARKCYGIKGSTCGYVHFGEWRAYQDPSF